MKMRKSTWLLLVLALAAILLVAGCSPTTPPNGEEPGNGEPTPPPTDKECPKVVVKSTTVADGYWALLGPVGGYFTKLTVTFNEPITSNCIEDPNRWDITVKNSGRRDTEITESENLVNILGVELSADGKKADVYFRVWEPLSYVVKDVVYQIDGESDIAEGVFPVEDEFVGLICSEDEAKDYATPSNEAIILAAALPVDSEILSYTLVSGPGAPKYADAVEWKLKDCVVADELGNACCDYSGSVCCIETTCAECEEGCTWGSESSCP